MNKYGKRANYDLAARQIKDGVWRINPEAGLIISTTHRRPIGSERTGYLRVKIGDNGPSVSSHRVIWEFVNGPSDLDLTINHKNGNGLDNRIENLEILSNGDNIRHAYANHLGGRRSRNTHCQYGHPFDSIYTDKNGHEHQLCSICNRVTMWGKKRGLSLAEAILVRPNGEPLPSDPNPLCPYGHDKRGRKLCHICSRIRGRGKRLGLSFTESLERWPNET